MASTDEKENKRKFAWWVKDSTIELVGKLYKDDDCTSRSEFIEKAVIFYAGYLSTENAKGYLPNVVTSTLKAIVDNSDNRQNRMMFKLAVEIAIVQNLIAATQDIEQELSRSDGIPAGWQRYGCANYRTACGQRAKALRAATEER